MCTVYNFLLFNVRQQRGSMTQSRVCSAHIVSSLLPTFGGCFSNLHAFISAGQALLHGKCTQFISMTSNPETAADRDRQQISYSLTAHYRCPLKRNGRTGRYISAIATT